MRFDASLLSGAVTLADGGWSTRLHLRGLAPDVLAETANLSHPELITELAHAYLDAGARFITTNTFSANRFVLARRGLTASVADINRCGAELARAAIGSRPAWVAGCIGPSGKILSVREIKPEELRPVFAEQARALAEGGADVILLETFSEIAEILLALEAAREVTGLPIIASMSFDSGPQRTRTAMGATAEECAAALDKAGADVIGLNCGSGIAHVLPAVVALRGATNRPLWVKPNAGLPDLEDGQPVWKKTPDEFAGAVPKIVAAGANVIGGCCGTGPEHIKRVAAILDRLPK